MEGYIAITMSDWLSCIRSLNITSAVFWCKKRNFKALSPGEKFYFLERGQFKSNAERYIVGSGEFSEFDKGNSEAIWKKYNNRLGFRTFDAFEAHIANIYHECSIEIGCIVLNMCLSLIRRYLLMTVM